MRSARAPAGRAARRKHDHREARRSRFLPLEVVRLRRRGHPGRCVQMKPYAAASPLAAPPGPRWRGSAPRTECAGARWTNGESEPRSPRGAAIALLAFRGRTATSARPSWPLCSDEAVRCGFSFGGPSGAALLWVGARIHAGSRECALGRRGASCPACYGGRRAARCAPCALDGSLSAVEARQDAGRRRPRETGAGMDAGGKARSLRPGGPHEQERAASGFTRPKAARMAAST